MLNVANFTIFRAYLKFDADLKNSVIHIEKSNVELWFEDLEETTEIPNNYEMVGFGLNE